MKRVIVKQHRPGHPWIFSNEIIKAEAAQVGEIVRVEEQRRIVGTGFYNPHSLISVRLFSKEERRFDKDFIRDKLMSALKLRNGLGTSFRLVYSESDCLPGLIIDKYNDYYVVQINSAGMERHKELLYNILIDEYQPKGIYEKSDENLRKLEGLDLINRVVYGKVPKTVEIEQDGLKFLVDIIDGQKTGFFFDQRENRQKISRLAKGEILDCFCYSGGFSLYVASKGNVLGFDSSAPAIDLAIQNAGLNNLACQFECVDLFEKLRRLVNEKRKFDTIIIDPPSFAKSKKKKLAALRGYKEINLRAMQLLKEGGILFTSSCSYHVSSQEFMRMLQDAAFDADKKFIIIQQGSQSKDHPILLKFPESNYLKAIFLRLLP